MEMLNKLSLGEKLIAGGGIVLLIASFLPWYRISVFNIVAVSANGWEDPATPFSIIAVLLGVVLAGAVIASRLGNVQLPAIGQFSWGQVYLAGGALVVIMMILVFISESSYLALGFYLAFLAAIAIAAGGYLQFTIDKGTGFNLNRR